MRIRRYAPAVTVLLLIVTGSAVLGASQWGVYQGYPVVRVMVDGEPVVSDVPAINFNGRTMVPLRFVSEALGASVTWEDSTWTAAVASPVTQTPEQLEYLERLLALWMPTGSGVSVSPDAFPAGPYSIEVRGWNLDMDYDKFTIAAIPQGYYSLLDGSPVPSGIREFTTDTKLRVNVPGTNFPPINFSMNILDFIIGQVDAVDGCFASQLGGTFKETGKYELWVMPPLSFMDSPKPTAFKVAARMAVVEVTVPESPLFTIDPVVMEEGWTVSYSPGAPLFYHLFEISGYGFKRTAPVFVWIYPEGQSESRRQLTWWTAPEDGTCGCGLWPGAYLRGLPAGRYVVEATQEGTKPTATMLTILTKSPMQATATAISTPSGTGIRVTGSGFWPSIPVTVRIALVPTLPDERRSWSAVGIPASNGFLDLNIPDALKLGPITGLIGIEQIGRNPLEVWVKGQ